MTPDGWRQGQVQDFLLLQRGFDLTKKSTTEGHIPVYSSSGLAYFHNEAKVKGPGIVTGRKGSVGPVYLVEEDFWPHDTTLWVKDFKGNEVKYIEFFLNFLNLERLDESSSVPTLNRNNVHGVRCVFPPLAEQKKIAQILSTWDKAITTTEQLLANSQQQKKALMQQLLTGKKRLLSDDGIRFSGEWKTVSIKDMGKVSSGGTPDTKRPEYWNGNLMWLTPTDVTALKTRYVHNTNRQITEAGANNSSAKLLPIGTLLICTRATVGAMAISTTEISTNQGFKNLIPNSKYTVDFIYYLLSFNKKLLIRKSSGSTFLELSKYDFDRIEVATPSLEEQREIAATLSTADNEITTLQQELTHLKQEKKSLMQQLLTGKRRVKIDQQRASS